MTLYRYILLNCREITPVWRVLIACLGTCCFAGLQILTEKKKWDRSIFQNVITTILYMYLAAVYASTVLCRPIYSGRYELELFWSYKLALAGSQSLKIEIIANCLLLIPLGLLFPYVTGKKKVLPTIWAGLFMTCLIEFSQLITGRGLFEFDDIFDNMVGVVVGFGVYLLSSFIWRKMHD